MLFIKPVNVSDLMFQNDTQTQCKFTLNDSMKFRRQILHKNHFEMLKIEIFDKIVTLWRNS